MLAKTGASKVALVANSRGCQTTRNYLRHGGADKAVAAVLCGGVNHGVFAIPQLLGSEYNGQGAFLTDLNSGDETEGVKTLTLRSDGYDLYAQPDGAYIGHAGMKTNITSDGPALKGAENLVLDHVDHRETAYSPRAFAEIYKFIVGARAVAHRHRQGGHGDAQRRGDRRRRRHRRPTSRSKAPRSRSTPSIPTPAPARARRCSSKTTGADGVWGPLQTDSKTALEFVVAAPDQFVTHIYRSPFPRSFAQLDLRPALASEGKGDAAAIVTMNRPRGYFGLAARRRS